MPDPHRPFVDPALIDHPYEGRVEVEGPSVLKVVGWFGAVLAWGVFLNWVGGF